jgi:hypothetical protein
LKVTVSVDQPLPGLKDRVLSVLPQALAVEVELEKGMQKALDAPPEQLTPFESFERYYTEKRGQGVPEEVRAAFLELHSSVTETPSEPG